VGSSEIAVSELKADRKILAYVVSGSIVILAAIAAYLLLGDKPGISTNVAADVAVDSESTSQTLTNVLLALSFAALVSSIWVNVFLLKWRRSVSTTDVSIVPSELLSITESQTKALGKNSKRQAEVFNSLAGELSKIFSNLNEGIGGARESSAQVLEAFTGLQDALSEKDKEIQRLRAGYDAEIYRRFLNRFLRLERTLNEEIEDASDESTELLELLKELRILLNDAFLDCGLEKFSPDIGAGIREADGIDENYKMVVAANAEEPLTIARIIEDGWRLNTPSGHEYIKKARVAVFVEQTAVEENT